MVHVSVAPFTAKITLMPTAFCDKTQVKGDKGETNSKNEFVDPMRSILFVPINMFALLKVFIPIQNHGASLNHAVFVVVFALF